MPDTQNAFVLPSPVSQQARQVQPSQPRQTHKANQANQARPSYKQHINKESNAAKDDGQDNVFTSFMALLNQVSAQPGQAGKTEAPASAGQIGELGEDVMALAGLTGKAPAFSKPILDLMASLENGLEENADVSALSEEMGEALNEMGFDTSGWDLNAVEAMLAKLREMNAAQGRGTELPKKPEEENGSQVTETKPLEPEAGLVKPDVKTPIAADAEEDVQEAETQPGDAKQMEENIQQAPQAVLDAPQGGQGSEADSAQPLAVSKFHAYLKPDAAKESPAQDVKPADNKAVKGQPADVGAAQVSPEAKSRDELSGGLNGHGEKQPDEQRKDAPVRSAPVRQEHQEAANADKDVSEPKAKTNFTENRPAFEQFFSAVTARRDAAAPAPQMELPRGSVLSQGDTLAEGLGNVVRFIRANGGQKANLIVDPPAIGRVSVELTSSSTGLEASIKVSSEQVRQLIQDHLTQLKLSLEQQGVQLTHFSVDVQQDNEHRNQGQSQKNQRRRAGVAGIDEEDSLDEDALFRVDLNQGLLYWVA